MTDAAGSERALLLGVCEGGPMALVFAACFPERVQGLVLYGTTARFTRTDDCPFGIPSQDWEELVELVRAEWGTGRVWSLVIRHEVDAIIPAERGRYLAEHIPGARYLEGGDAFHVSWRPEDPSAMRDRMRDVLVAVGAPPRPPTRVLATVCSPPSTGPAALSTAPERWPAPSAHSTCASEPGPRVRRSGSPRGSL